MASVKGSCTLFLFLQLKIDTYLFILKNPPTFKHIVYQIRLDSVKAQSSAQKSFFYWNKTKLPAGCHTGGNTTFLKPLLFFSQIYIYQCIYIMNVWFFFFFLFQFLKCHYSLPSTSGTLCLWEWQLLTLYISFIIDIMLK